MDNIKTMEDFWALVQDVWNNGFAGIDVGKLLIAAGIFLIFLIFRRLLAKLISIWFARIAKRTTNELDDRMLEALEGPIFFIPVVMGLFVAIEVLKLEGQLANIGEGIIRTLIAYNIFWGLLNAIEPISYLTRKLRRIFTEELVDWLVRALRVLVVLIGAATILEIWGIQVGPILAGLGLFGVAVALGAQDLFKNLIAGILILAEKRFKKGDWIRVDGVVEGTVENIGFRSTFVRRFDKAPVFVPNTKLSDSAVTNFSAMTHRRINWKIGLEYSTSIEQLRYIRDEIEGYILGNDDFAQPPEVSTFVRIDSFNDSSIDILLYCFTKTTVWGEWLEIKEKLAYRIMEIVEKAGTGFAFPSQSLYIEAIPGETAEIFVPPKSRKRKKIPLNNPAEMAEMDDGDGS